MQAFRIRLGRCLILPTFITLVILGTINRRLRIVEEKQTNVNSLEGKLCQIMHITLHISINRLKKHCSCFASY